jgi:glucose-1-phosphate thymidylyltransferase
MTEAKPLSKAVILARGLGKRMRREDDTVGLEAGQSAVADSGMKAMIPVGRPFLDYILSTLADAGFTEVCLVVGPEHNAIREYYVSQHRPSRIGVSYAIQETARGTADAVLAARRFVDREEFAVMNSDNYYPLETLLALQGLRQPGTVLFEESSLVRESNIPPDRIRAFAYGIVDGQGFLSGLLEKPDDATVRALGEQNLISMNLWRFSPQIFEVCSNVSMSPRGEYELPMAVRDAIGVGMKLKVAQCSSGVLDLSQRADIPAVAARLKQLTVSL